jgi:hypothetical protein
LILYCYKIDKTFANQRTSTEIPMQIRMHIPQENYYENQNTQSPTFELLYFVPGCPGASFFNDTIFNFLIFLNKQIKFYFSTTDELAFTDPHHSMFCLFKLSVS